MRYTDAYVTTLPVDAAYSPTMTAIRERARLINAEVRMLATTMGLDGADAPRLNIRIHGRLGKDSPHRHLYRTRRSCQRIAIQHSARVDVYANATARVHSWLSQNDTASFDAMRAAEKRLKRAGMIQALTNHIHSRRKELLG